MATWLDDGHFQPSITDNLPECPSKSTVYNIGKDMATGRPLAKRKDARAPSMPAAGGHLKLRMCWREAESTCTQAWLADELTFTLGQQWN